MGARRGALAYGGRSHYGCGMFLTRKIGSVLRGNVTPLQVLLATTLGGMLGFIPDDREARDSDSHRSQVPHFGVVWQAP